MKQIMAVYDVDPLYADRFAEFVNQKEQVPFCVMAFTSLEKLRKYSQEHVVHILLVNAQIGREEIKKILAKQIMMLSDGEIIPLEEDYPSVYKYQSTDSIIREVMACYCVDPNENTVVLAMRTALVIGIYSPVNRCMKTSFALILGQLMARDNKVLYLNLEEGAGFSELMGIEFKGDLSDVLYYYRQGSYSRMRLGSCVYSLNDLSYIPPVRYPEDLYQVAPEELAGLVRQIAAESRYGTLVVDMGQMGRYCTDLLDLCQVVYMPVKEDCVSLAKLTEFERYLEISGKGYLKDKIKRLKLPCHNSMGRRESYLDQLLWGELGDFARQLLKGQVTS